MPWAHDSTHCAAIAEVCAQSVVGRCNVVEITFEFRQDGNWLVRFDLNEWARMIKLSQEEKETGSPTKCPEEQRRGCWLVRNSELDLHTSSQIFKCGVV